MIELKRVDITTVEVTPKELFRNASKLGRHGFTKELVRDEIIDFIREHCLAIFGNEDKHAVVFNGYHDFLEVRQNDKSFNDQLRAVIDDHS
jgi:hypothetical protein